MIHSLEHFVFSLISYSIIIHFYDFSHLVLFSSKIYIYVRFVLPALFHVFLFP